MTTYDVVIIGGGAAGLAAAIKTDDGKHRVLIIERDDALGGILNQCIHNGFGLHVFNEMLTGPEFAARLIDDVVSRHIPYLLNTTVSDVKEVNHELTMVLSSSQTGISKIRTKAIILATGCYERSRGAISIPGDRPNGIMTAGAAQKYLNIDGYLVGKNIFILGSGDIGLIMARRMTLEGAKVHGVAEIMPYSNGLNRNIAQCLQDFDIPLYLSHTVSEIKGDKNLESITIQSVDENMDLIPNTKKTFAVDTLLLSVGLIPDIKVFESLDLTINPITKSIVVDQNYQSDIPGIFACGNALHVHDLVDDVVLEAQRAGHAVNHYLNQKKMVERQYVDITFDHHIRYIVPNRLSQVNWSNGFITLLFRTNRKFTKAIFIVKQGHEEIKRVNATFIVPAEMNKIEIEASLINHQKPLHIELVEVL